MTLPNCVAREFERNESNIGVLRDWDNLASQIPNCPPSGNPNRRQSNRQPRSRPGRSDHNPKR